MNERDLRDDPHAWRSEGDGLCSIFGLLLGIGAVASGVGSLASAGGQIAGAADQAQAEKNALDFQKQVWGQTQKNLAPSIQALPGAISSVQSGVGTATNPGPWTTPFDWSQIANNPAYKFILDQGTQGIVDQASATGGIGGGNTLKALLNYGQGAAAQFGNMLFGENLATQQNQFGDAYSLASLAQNAAAGLGGIGASTGANVADTYSQLGNAQAGTANSIGSGLGSLMQNPQLAALFGPQISAINPITSGYAPVTAGNFDPGALAPPLTYPGG